MEVVVLYSRKNTEAKKASFERDKDAETWINLMSTLEKGISFRKEIRYV